MVFKVAINEAFNKLELPEATIMIVIYTFTPIIGLCCLLNGHYDEAQASFIIILASTLFLMIIYVVAEFISNREESLKEVKRNEDKICKSIKEHCKRSCTAENCNNCALRPYNEKILNK